MTKKQLSASRVRDFDVGNNVKKLIENIHDAHYSGEFSDADIVNLRSAFARSTNNYYQLLDISPKLEKSSFDRELKLKYRQLCLRFHPDCTSANISKTEIFELIKTAYETLSDPNLRENYNISSSFEIIEISMRNLAPLVKKHNPPHNHLDLNSYQYDKRLGIFYKYEGRYKNLSESDSQKIASATFLILIGLAACTFGIYIICGYAKKLHYLRTINKYSVENSSCTYSQSSN